MNIINQKFAQKTMRRKRREKIFNTLFIWFMRTAFLALCVLAVLNFISHGN